MCSSEKTRILAYFMQRLEQMIDILHIFQTYDLP